MSEMNRFCTQKDLPEGREIWLAGGCFWGAEKYLSGIHGVLHTCVGYAGGRTPFPSYEQVCSHTTGHAEAVHVVYDPAQVSLRHLLMLFSRAIDPTSVNRQGGDVGDQYRTGIYTVDEAADMPVIQAVLKALAQQHDKPIAIEAGPLTCFYPAEAYHQQYLEKNPGGYCHISDALCREAAAAKE